MDSVGVPGGSPALALEGVVCSGKACTGLFGSMSPGLDPTCTGLGPGLVPTGPGLVPTGPGLVTMAPGLVTMAPGLVGAGLISGDSDKGTTSLRFAKSSLSLVRDEAEKLARAKPGVTKSLPVGAVSVRASNEHDHTEDKTQSSINTPHPPTHSLPIMTLIHPSPTLTLFPLQCVPGILTRSIVPLFLLRSASTFSSGMRCAPRPRVPVDNSIPGGAKCGVGGVGGRDGWMGERWEQVGE